MWTAVPAEALAVPQICIVHAVVVVLAWRARSAAAQQTERGDDRIERIQVLCVVRHDPILHAT